MSSPERTGKVLLSPRARQDFIDILRYTGETWGTRQLHVYRDKINDALQIISRNPAMGHRSSELPETHRFTSLDLTSSFTATKKHRSRLFASCIKE